MDEISLENIIIGASLWDGFEIMVLIFRILEILYIYMPYWSMIYDHKYMIII